jgi:hypothetical protein
VHLAIWGSRMLRGHSGPLGGVSIECTNGTVRRSEGIANRATRMRCLEIGAVSIRIRYITGVHIDSRTWSDYTRR